MSGANLKTSQARAEATIQKQVVQIGSLFSQPVGTRCAKAPRDVPICLSSSPNLGDFRFTIPSKRRLRSPRANSDERLVSQVFTSRDQQPSALPANSRKLTAMVEAKGA